MVRQGVVALFLYSVKKEKTMTEYKPIEAWKRSCEEESVQLEALFDSLYAAGKVSEKDVKGLLGGPYQLSKGYLGGTPRACSCVKIGIMSLFGRK